MKLLQFIRYFNHAAAQPWSEKMASIWTYKLITIDNEQINDLIYRIQDLWEFIKETNKQHDYDKF